jgi:hypothetical protein
MQKRVQSREATILHASYYVDLGAIRSAHSNLVQPIHSKGLSEHSTNVFSPKRKLGQSA